jgi:hypothetical protein
MLFSFSRWAILSNHLSLLSRVIQIGHMTVTLIVVDLSSKLLAPRCGYSVLCVVELKEAQAKKPKESKQAPPYKLGLLRAIPKSCPSAIVSQSRVHHRWASGGNVDCARDTGHFFCLKFSSTIK